LVVSGGRTETVIAVPASTANGTLLNVSSKALVIVKAKPSELAEMVRFVALYDELL
jgi:hypothetical protein